MNLGQLQPSSTLPNTSTQPPQNSYLAPTDLDLNNLTYTNRIPILLFLDLPQLLCIYDVNFGLVIRQKARQFIQFLIENYYLAIWNSDSGQRSHLYTSSIFGEFKYELLAVLDRDNEEDFKGKKTKRFDKFFDASLITNDIPGKIENECYIISTSRSLSVFQPDNTLFIHSQKDCNSFEVKQMLIPSMLDTNTYPDILDKLMSYLKKLRDAYLKDENLTIQNYVDEHPFIP
ncbi:hypothetical protein CONCODRAFT_77469 [Conidiobolus coronatus NRRL 28638]|uniref:FCP1 homology domain-containing protein n=1 Tax=Conidiobolus coronatus (strain ATCC 28846 / CBS 209.66 / NRRL 28638) TaxID=796925 RepID=A0A137PDQ8_CONC2|nr:hypothetical protein CONCODRAFT_77469 [Conidiobolus coronatus NRRL 28638]|eukprot:KXN73102.1 hypothetical protein CONCODRAFT_77469 [Conidiobolus coronatus NRRL 28638]